LTRVPAVELQRLMNVGTSGELRLAAADVALDAVECASFALAAMERCDVGTARDWLRIANEWVTVMEGLRQQADLRDRQSSWFAISEKDPPEVRKAFTLRFIYRDVVSDEVS